MAQNQTDIISIEASGLEVLSAEEVESCRLRRQGDVLALDSIPILGLDGTRDYGLSLGAAVISQTCDIVLPSRPNVAVAAVARLGVLESKEAREGKRPRYINLPALGQDYFVDMEYVGSVTKKKLVRIDFEPGVDPLVPVQVRAFALQVGRRFGRFPFPDELVPWLRPLQRIVQEKHDSRTSGLGLALNEVTELRIEAVDWLAEPLDLTLHVIVKAGVLAEFGDQYPDIPENLREWLMPDGQLIRSAAQVADRLFAGELNRGPHPTLEERYHLWFALGDALAASCTLRGRDRDDAKVSAAVRRIVGEVSSEDEFSLVQYRRSEMLDLDHLSTPTPYETELVEG